MSHPCPACKQRIPSDIFHDVFSCPSCGEELHVDDFMETVEFSKEGSAAEKKSPKPAPASNDGDDIGLPGMEVLETLGTGGFGSVYRAVEDSMGREIAVKVLHDSDSDDGRFFSEAVITGNLQHPNIIPVHSLGTNREGRQFFTMKIAAGTLLDDILDKLSTGDMPTVYEFPVPRLLNIFLSICDAVAYAHSQGIIHRDLKPANIMIGDFGQTYVLDWGLARILSQEEPPTPRAARKKKRGSTVRISSTERIKSRLSRVSSETMDGTIMGTPGYMPPEQATGNLSNVDKRGDVYSLGAILYEILTLRLPVNGKKMDELLRNTEKGAIILIKRAAGNRSYPPEVAAIAMKALALKPKRRYKNVTALADDIRAYLEDREVSVFKDSLMGRSLKWMRRNRSATAGLIAAGIVGVIASLLIFGLVLHNARADAQAEKKANIETTKRLKAEEKALVAEQQAHAAERQEKEKLASRASAYTFYIRAKNAATRPGMQRKALEDLDEALRLSPDFLEARFLRVEVRRMLSMFDQAIDDCNELDRISLKVTGKGHAPAMRLAGDIWRDRMDGANNTEAALACFDKAAKIDPDDPHGQLAKVVAYYIRGERDRAIQEVQKHSKAHPNFWENYYVLGYLLMGQSRDGRKAVHKPDYPGAIQAFSKAIQLQPNKANLYQNRGSCSFMYFQKTKDKVLLKSAMNDLQLAATLQPNQPVTWKNLLKIHYLMLKDYDAALHDVDQLERISGDTLNMDGTRAFIYEAQGRYYNALEAIKKALEKAPGDAGLLKFKTDIEKKVAEMEKAPEK